MSMIGTRIVTRRVIRSLALVAYIGAIPAAIANSKTVQSEPVISGFASPTREIQLYVHKPQFVIEEYLLVKPGKEKEVIEWYLANIEPVLKTFPGYLGMEVLSTEAGPSVKDPTVAALIGPPNKAILPHLGIMMDGVVRTDRQINFHSMLRSEYNLMYRHYLADEDTFKKLMEGHDKAGEGDAPTSLPGRWKKMRGTDLWDVMAKEYFSNTDNHWDVVYRFVRTD